MHNEIATVFRTPRIHYSYCEVHNVIYTFLYLGNIVVYLWKFGSLLAVVVVVIAIKSRKIRLKQFNDTKQVNILILFVSAISFYFWYAGIYDQVHAYVLCTGHLILAFLCQIFLFVPKVWPPLRDRLVKKLQQSQ